MERETKSMGIVEFSTKKDITEDEGCTQSEPLSSRARASRGSISGMVQKVKSMRSSRRSRLGSSSTLGGTFGRAATVDFYRRSTQCKDVDSAPGIGGVEFVSPLPMDILPPEAVLFEPAESDIKSGHTRKIFLNTPLDQEEQQDLWELQRIAIKEGLAIPLGMRIYLLRCLQYHKGNPQKALAEILDMYNFRASQLPISETEEVLSKDLATCWMYWYGRDMKCRPVLVFRIDRMGVLTSEPDRVVRVAAFLLETIIRYALVPGRIEHWCVILDLQNASKPQIPTIKALINTVRGKYRFRMGWTKIVNAPGWFSTFWSWIIKPLLPPHTREKIDILGPEYPAELRKLVVPHQLEMTYGGTAEPLAAPLKAGVPMRFPPGPFTQIEPAGIRPPGQSPQLQDHVDRAFHEGALWEELSEPHQGRAWVEPRRLQASCLTPKSALHAAKLCGSDVAPTTTIEGFLENCAMGAQFEQGYSLKSVEGDLKHGRVLTERLEVARSNGDHPNGEPRPPARAANAQAPSDLTINIDELDPLEHLLLLLEEDNSFFEEILRACGTTPSPTPRSER